MKIRRVDTLFGALFILIAGCAGTYAIVHTINTIPPEYFAGADTYNASS
jgi:hypothetical protein